MRTGPRGILVKALAGLAIGVMTLTCGQQVAGQPAAADEPPVSVTVLSRNIYLGADVGTALRLLPDMPAAAQFMWDQMRSNDITQRATALAGEVHQGRPDVIGLQEAATWYCSRGLGQRQVVYDFTGALLDALAVSGQQYVIASDGTRPARNEGFSIGPIPWVTTVHDPEVFRPRFGSDEAQCGFTVADVLLIRADLQDSVLATGTVDYHQDTAIVPILMVISRGYAWADIRIGGTPIRFVTTHLESIWEPDQVPASTRQAQQLTQDLASTSMPLVVLGDFNSDPRDPRPKDANPGDQPEISSTCPEQSGQLDATCSAYWTMIRAGFTDAGPDSQDPANLTWGTSADLSGPDPIRAVAAQRLGNATGMTERIDFVFVRNGAVAGQAAVIGDSWWDPNTTWPCGELRDDGPTRCLASDHAGVLATVAIPHTGIQNSPLVGTGASSENWLWIMALIALVVLLGGLVVLTLTRRKGRHDSA